MGSEGASLSVAGIAIAVVSSFINGSTFVLQKKGILRSRARGRPKRTETRKRCSKTNKAKSTDKRHKLRPERHTSAFCYLPHPRFNVLLYFPQEDRISGMRCGGLARCAVSTAPPIVRGYTVVKFILTFSVQGNVSDKLSKT